MADHFVNAGADTLWELVVIEGGRVALSFDASFVDNTIDLVGRYSFQMQSTNKHAVRP